MFELERECRVRLFVSHSGRDRAWAEWVAWQLEHAGWGVSAELDCWDWHAGDNFVAKINSALASCDHMVAICSQAYYEPARWTNEEWTAALRMAKDRPRFLVPVRIDDAPAPPLLAGLITPALHGLPVDQVRATLLGAIRPPGRPDREPPLPARAGGGQGEGPRLPGVLPPVWGVVPARNEAFTGRDGMLVRLREGLRGSGRSVVHALHGAGGVGKTQLATEYAWRFANDYEAVWWVNAEQADRIGEQYAAFAVTWGLVDPATQVGPAVDTLRTYCRSRTNWLVVLDNAVSASEVREWLLAGPGHVLVTSRNPHWPPEMGTAVSVDVFARGESIALLHAHLPILPDDHAHRLAEALGDLPLALAQAAGFLSETAMPATEYLNLLDTTAAEVLDEGTPISYPRSLAKSLRIAVEQLRITDPAAAQLLRLCAFLAPEPIPTRWFRSAGPAILPKPLAATVAVPLPFRRTLGLLSRYGLAKLADDYLTVHRLTQRLLRADTTDPKQATTTVENLLAAVSPGRPTDPTTWPTWADLLPHLRTVDLAGTDNDQLAWQACETALYLLLRGEPHAYHNMIAPLHQAWLDRRGPDARSTLWAANHLAHALAAVGRPQDAITLERNLLTHFRDTHGEDHLETLIAANNLALRLGELGEHEQARALAEDTLTRRRRVLGDDHPNTLSSADNLALRLAELGEHEQARKVEDWIKRHRGA
jgi:hypothetical protein